MGLNYRFSKGDKWFNSSSNLVLSSFVRGSLLLLLAWLGLVFGFWFLGLFFF